MFKRVRWLLLGGVLGVWVYLWARGKAHRMPSKAVDAATSRGVDLAEDAAARGRDLVSRLRDALAEGREAMRAKEAELRDELASTRSTTR